MNGNKLQLADVLGSVLWSLQFEIAPTVTDEYAASICKTAAALLRSCLVRLESEGQFLVEDNAKARAVITQAAAAVHDETLSASMPPAVGSPQYRPLADLAGESDALTAALSETMRAVRAAAVAAPQDAEIAAAHKAAEEYLGEHLSAQASWLLEPFTGDIR